MMFFKNHWKLFIVVFVVPLLLLCLPNLGIKSQISQLKSPLPFKTDIFDSLKPKLEQKINTFQLKNNLDKDAPYLNQLNSYIVVDVNNREVLLGKDIEKQYAFASLTKIMTAIVSLDLSTPLEYFTVTQKAADMEPTKIGIEVGEKLSLQELLEAILLTSANDSAEMIKEGIDQKYQEKVFIEAMNYKAQFLGLKNTHFSNPQGLDDSKNYSSTDDLAQLCLYALEKYPEIAAIVRKSYQFLAEDQNHKQFDLYNWNGLLGVYPGVYGIKIGNTDEAGHTIAVIAEREGEKVLVIILGATSVLERDLQAGKLLDLGFHKLGIKSANITEKELREKYSIWRYLY